MDPFSVLVLAISLGMDAFSVSLCGGLAISAADASRRRLGSALRAGICFGGFQALMPLLGWLGGQGFRRVISAFDHWVAFGLLLLVGGKMIYEAAKGTDACEPMDLTDPRLLLGLGVATSIDALAVGVSFALLAVDIALPVTVIGVVAAAMSVAGVYLGSMVNGLRPTRIQFVGGLVLVGIGVRILATDLAGNVAAALQTHLPI